MRFANAKTYSASIRARKLAYLFKDKAHWIRTFARTSLTSFVDIVGKMFVELSDTMLREETRHDRPF